MKARQCASAAVRIALTMLVAAALAVPPASAAPPGGRRAAACLADLEIADELEVGIFDGPGGPDDELESPLIPTIAVWSVLAGPLIATPGTDGNSISPTSCCSPT